MICKACRQGFLIFHEKVKKVIQVTPMGLPFTSQALPTGTPKVK